MKSSPHAHHPFRVVLYDNISPYNSHGGILRYFRKLTDGIIAAFGSNVLIISPEKRVYGPAKYVRSFRFRGSQELMINQTIASLVAYREQATVLYSPYYDFIWTKAKKIGTIYDFIFELFPHYLPKRNYFMHRFLHEKKLSIERAAALLVISKSSANDTLRLYPSVDPTKMTICYPGVDSFFFEGEDQNLHLPDKPFLLYVGRLTGYKNFPRLLIAFGQSGLAKDFDLRVISPLEKTFGPQETESIEQYNLQTSVHLLTAVSDEVLRRHYATSYAFIYPSEYEGFGMPILEAFASGTLVATSQTASMPEAGGDVAFYFNPYDIDSIAACLLELTRLSDKQRLARIASGRARAREFTWERCLQQTANVFRQVGGL